MTHTLNRVADTATDSEKMDRASGNSLARYAKNIATRCLPSFVLKDLRSYYNLGRAERPAYVKIRLLDAMGVGNGKQKAPSSGRSVLFVCFGNRMRSPMCEALMKREMGQHCAGITIRSAGVHATPGKAAHAWAIAAARELGLSLDNHHAQLLTAEMVKEADVIFAMDYRNEVELLTLYPEAKDKVFMLGAYAGEAYRDVEIADPYYGDADQTRLCYGILERCIRQFASELRENMKLNASNGNGVASANARGEANGA